MKSHRKGFTIIELLVVVSIIALLIGILLPAIGKARDQAKQTQSLTNLRNLGTAHASYAAEWNDRQFTLCVDTISSYGNSLAAAFGNYTAQNGNTVGGQHPGAILGWGHLDGNGAYVLFMYRCDGNMANASLTIPINFIGGVTYFGSFRLANCRQFNQYVSGKFYDKVFYAPKDTIVWEDVDGGSSGFSCFDSPDEFCDRPPLAGFGDVPTWSSYVLSPAAMFAPQVMQRQVAGDDDSGWKNPWSLPAGMRSPAMGQARYPGLKTHMLEHHWLQSRRSECNPAFEPGTYGGCEPFYFNMAWESSPMTLFYDGHVESVGVRKCERADGRQRAQSGNEYGLWSKDTIYGANGYFINAGYDDANTSFHIFTTDGILGRDITAD